MLALDFPCVPKAEVTADAKRPLRCEKEDFCGTKGHECDGRVSGTALGPSSCLARYVFQVGLLMSLGLAVSNVA
jgi:hypothetical protein